LDVSIIIVNWNTKGILRNCLQSIYEQTDGIDFEVIVVDNASTDGSPNMVRIDFPKVLIIENSENRGFAAGVNRGIVLAKGRYALVLNSDTIICDNAIEKTVRYAHKHPEAAVVGCQVCENSGIIRMTCFDFPSVFSIFCKLFGLAKIFKRNRLLGREQMLWWDRKSERQVHVVSGMFMLVRREAADEVGGMDEDYFLFYEETDWCYRFAEAGWKMLFWPGAKVFHIHGGGQSRKKDSLRSFIQFRKSLLIYFKKHHSSLQGFIVRILLIIDAVVRCIIWAALMILKKLLGKDASTESANMKNYWWLFKFCLSSIEPVHGI